MASNLFVIIECLKAGNLKINPKQKQIEIADGQLIFPYDKIPSTAWGYVYEKYVGQILESENFKISYNSFGGGADYGIDLIAEKGRSITFIQCKYSKTKKLSKSHIDHILYKASNKLQKACLQYEGKRIAFALIVHSKKRNFRRKAPKGFINPYSSSNNTDYPWLQYFLSHNHTQNKVKVGFREIPMHT